MKDEDDLGDALRTGVRRLVEVLIYDGLLAVTLAPVGFSGFWRGAEQIGFQLFWIVAGPLSFLCLILPDAASRWCLRLLMLLIAGNLAGWILIILNWKGHG